MKIKRIIRLASVVSCFFFFIFLVSSPDVVGAAADLPEISAEAAVLYDWNSGRVLYAKNPHLPRPMASTTKIMTAILALERGNLKDLVLTSPVAAHVEGSSIWLEEGEEKTLEELLFGLMLCSGNDAAQAIAEHLSGSGEKFAEEMTARAKELGARDTVFKNPHGLHHSEHHTTAYDFTLIAAHAMGMKEFRRIISAPHVVISWPGHPWDRYLYNQNKLLDTYRGAEGIKTGWTTPAGRCFVGAAERGGRRLITVVLDAPQMWEDTAALLDYGFDNFTYRALVEKNRHLKSVPVLEGVGGKVEAIAADNFLFPMAATEKKTLPIVS